jgi:ABC-2 type transport system permease protein
MSFVKYGKVLQITVFNSLAYIYDMMVSSLFMVIIMFIFINLWDAIYQNKAAIDGFTFPMMIWYLVMTESIIFSERRFSDQISDDVRAGTIAYNLNKPYSYVLFKFMQFVGDAIFRFSIAFIFGSLLAYFFVGPIEFQIQNVLSFVSVAFALTLSFLFVMIIGILAFWLEDTRSFYFLLHKLIFTLGGMLIPLELFPSILQKIAVVLPFQAICYLPAKLFVAFSYDLFFQTILIQIFWIVVLMIITFGIFIFAMRRLEINGG